MQRQNNMLIVRAPSEKIAIFKLFLNVNILKADLSGI